MMNVAPALAHCVWLAAPPEWARFALGRPGGKTTLALRDK